MYKIVERNRGGNKLMYQGYIYSKHRSNEVKIDWRCIEFQRSCRGRAITRGDNIVVTQDHQK